jgi:tryptophan-rich sensory protein
VKAGIWKPVLVAALAAMVVATLGATVTDIGSWYAALRKPSWQPPDWLFGPVWTLIYALTAISGVMAWRKAPDRGTRDWILVLFALNGFLNILWSLLFFRLRRPDWALFEVVFLWVSILVPIIVLARFSKPASALLLPYLAWVSFAAYLNFVVVRLNEPFASIGHAIAGLIQTGGG